MKRAVLIATLLALVAGGSAPAKPFHSLLGIVDDGVTARLVGLDSETLVPFDGQSLVLGKRFGSWSFSPNRAQLAYADGDRLRFFDVAEVRSQGGVQMFGAGPVAWVDSGTVVVLRKFAANGVEVVKVDAATHAVRSRQRVAGVVLAARTTSDAVVALLGRNAKIAPSRLLVVDRARTRILPLGIWAGTYWQGRNPPVGTMRIPGFAVDQERARAFVVDADGTIVAMPLAASRAVSHRVHGRFAKLVHGSVRTASALGDGLLAVTGSELTPAGTEPAGLELVDTRTWSSRLVFPSAAASMSVSPVGLLATGTTFDRNSQKQSSMGLAILDRTGQVRYRLFDGKRVFVHALVGSRAFVAVEGERDAVIIDVFTGAVLGHRPLPLPTPLVARSSSDELP
jgi:hypothetical protein